MESSHHSDYDHEINKLLKPLLPKGFGFDLVHIRSSPQKSRKLVFTSKNDNRLDSLITHYFMLVHKNVSILSSEVLTYESPNYFTVFVSKADTTGCYEDSARLSMLQVTQGLMRAVLRFFSPVNKRIRIALFAMAQSQYLFLGSAKNPHKHVLTDAQLVSWWVKCLDGLYNEANLSEPIKACLSIPGIDESSQAIAKYFPPNSHLPWSAGDIFWQGKSPEADNDEWAVNRIPRFPDDPKSRFLNSIVAENRGKKVTKRQFWLELQSRQEFRLGKSVGIIGVEFNLNPGLHLDFSKSSAQTQRDTQRFKDLSLSLNFETKASTEYATKKISKFVDEKSRYHIKGDGPVMTRIAKTQRAAPVNTLNTCLVRKKQKKT